MMVFEHLDNSLQFSARGCMIESPIVCYAKSNGSKRTKTLRIRIGGGKSCTSGITRVLFGVRKAGLNKIK